MSLRARVQRLVSQRQGGLGRIEVWLQDEDGDMFTCGERPGERMTLQQLEARDEPDLALFIVSHAPAPPEDLTP